MRVSRENDRIVLRFAPFEARLMRRIFATIARYYQMKFDGRLRFGADDRGANARVD